jgi:1,4-alpha-glucan branching enzyme
VQPHAFGFGYDFNHETADTKYFVNRVTEHWLTQYKIDGFRFDFSKGFTQKPSSNDAQFSAYDQSRIDILKDIYNNIKTTLPDAYMILEHLTANDEEKELANNGMLLWGNMNANYAQASLGYATPDPGGNAPDFTRGIYTARTWSQPNLITYMESHDEERINYKNLKYGNASGSYNIKDTAIALKRMELSSAFLFTIPGPKMIWQFGELGYDYSRCYLSTNGEGGECDKKLDAKPVRWDYLTDVRRKHLYNVYSRLIALRFNQWYKDAFISGTISQSLNSTFKWIKVSSGDSSHLLVVGNFDVVPQTATVSFQNGGTWYDYLDSTLFTATGVGQSITLQPGEFHVYVNRNLNNSTATPVIDVPWNEIALEAHVYPNPITSSFTMEVKLPQSANIVIDLYNSVGQYVKTVSSRFLPKGSHQLQMKSLDVARGRYYLQLSTKQAAKTIAVTIQ